MRRGDCNRGAGPSSSGHQLVQANVKYVLAGRVIHLFLDRCEYGTCFLNLVSSDFKSASNHHFLESLSVQIFSECFAGITFAMPECFQVVPELEECFAKYVEIFLSSRLPLDSSVFTL